jgi:hypothetical protein
MEEDFEKQNWGVFMHTGEKLHPQVSVRFVSEYKELILG